MTAVKSYKFTGPEPRDVPSLGLVDVQPGDVIEVSAAAAKGLEGQDVWEHVTTANKKNQEG